MHTVHHDKMKLQHCVISHVLAQSDHAFLATVGLLFTLCYTVFLVSKIRITSRCLSSQKANSALSFAGAASADVIVK